ncbi:MAG: CRISPR-associated endonuclease Cas1, partial [Bacteroidales bacterium]
MFTHKDIELRTIFVVYSIEKKNLRVEGGNLLLEDAEENKKLTKLPFQKLLAIFAIGHITVTTALIDKCTKYGVPLIVMKPNFRIVFFFSISAEANFLLRQKQFEYSKDNLQIAKIIVTNKIKNTQRLLEKTRKKETATHNLIIQCAEAIEVLDTVDDYDSIMGIEGVIAKAFFSIYFKHLGWKNRCPRAKMDPINACLDIGYTILFNYIEAFVRLFGFDPYIG